MPARTSEASCCVLGHFYPDRARVRCQMLSADMSADTPLVAVSADMSADTARGRLIALKFELSSGI